MDELSKDDIKDCLSNYTLRYITAYIEAKGDMKGIPDKYRPSKENPALKDLDWWLDGELDGIYGPPSEEEKAERRKKAEQREKEIAALQHKLVFQLRFSKGMSNLYPSYEMITDRGMSSSPISDKELREESGNSVYEDDVLIYSDQRRFITVRNKDGAELVYEISHPVKPSPCEWGKWVKPNYILKDGMDKFELLNGINPKSKVEALPENTPELRFKVIKN